MHWRKIFFFKIFLKFIYFWERERETDCEWGRGRERGRHRIWSRIQALSCQHRDWRGARTHEPWDHDLSRSRTLNWLSHPGAPKIFWYQSTYTLHWRPLSLKLSRCAVNFNTSCNLIHCRSQILRGSSSKYCITGLHFEIKGPNTNGSSVVDHHC